MGRSHGRPTASPAWTTAAGTTSSCASTATLGSASTSTAPRPARPPGPRPGSLANAAPYQIGHVAGSGPLPGRRGRGRGLQHAARSGADPGTPRRGGTGHHPARGHARHSHRRFDDHRHHAGLRRQRGHGRWGLTDGHRQGVRGNGHRRPPHADAERLALPDWHLLGRRGARAAARHVHRARRAVGLGGQHGLQPHAHLHDRRRPATRRPGPDGRRRHCRLRRIRR